MTGRYALAVAMLTWGLTTGCSLLQKEHYPPAYPVPPKIPWDPTKPFLTVKAVKPHTFCPQPVMPVKQTFGLPTAEEWQGQWKLKPVTHRLCKGTGKQRRCTVQPATAVDQANRQAVIRATPGNTRGGASGHIRFPYDPREDAIYELVLSPHEYTYLVLLPGERQAAPLLLNPQHWEVHHGKSGEAGSVAEVITVRPQIQNDGSLPQSMRAVVVYQSGKRKQLLFKAQERPGMLSVEWLLEEAAKPPPEPPVDQQPPAFNRDQLYAAYTIELTSKSKMPPPWLPEAVMDDGVNTLIKFRTTFEGVRLPLVTGVQQNGQPALVQTRLYVRPGHGAWLWARGLWPAWTLKDAAGITVKAVRSVPTPESEVSHALPQM